MMPALSACTSSPVPGTSVTIETSAVRTISTSSCPTPTVSMMTMSLPDASSTRAASPVARASRSRRHRPRSRWAKLKHCGSPVRDCPPGTRSRPDRSLGQFRAKLACLSPAADTNLGRCRRLSLNWVNILIATYSTLLSNGDEPPHPVPLPWGEGEPSAALSQIQSASTRPSAGRGVPSPCGRGPG